VRTRAERWAPWLAGAVLIAGIGAYAVTHWGKSSSGPVIVQRATPLAPAERRVATEFVDTAVARKHLDRAWAISGPELKQDLFLSEWKTGSIPVVPYPVADASVLLRTINSFTDAARLRVSFVPHAGAKVNAATFTLGLTNVNGHWLVSSWDPSSVVEPQQGK
jgi:hypothetical protein